MEIEEFFRRSLEQRKSTGLLRKLVSGSVQADFCSNDYLGFAARRGAAAAQRSGASGSRLLSGNSAQHEDLEREIAAFHEAQAALLFCSGYQANLGLLSAVPQRSDTIIYDQLSHASIRDGVRLSLARGFGFKHNDLDELRGKLRRAAGRRFVCVESVYSMDGDFAPLAEIAEICRQFRAELIVDEAHATGVFGAKGGGRVQELGLQQFVTGRVHTFGKALGCHGAAVVGSAALREYLINYCRPFIYTTAAGPACLAQITAAYRLLPGAERQRQQLQRNIGLFRALLKDDERLLTTEGPIQAVIVAGAAAAHSAAEQLQGRGFDVRPILSPTVPQGRERLRICLHSFNTKEEISGLAAAIKEMQ